jgi:hypothetical protein
VLLRRFQNTYVVTASCSSSELRITCGRRGAPTLPRFATSQIWRVDYRGTPLAWFETGLSRLPLFTAVTT